MSTRYCKAAQLHNKLKAVSKSHLSTCADNTQLTNHERRPEGPTTAVVDLELTAEEAAVRTSLVAALDLPGQVPHLNLCLHCSLCCIVEGHWHASVHCHAVPLSATAACGLGVAMQTPILLPEKLSTSRCLVEIVDNASTDLAGDAGAVGRFSVVQHGQQQQVQLDLKGTFCCSCHGAPTLSSPSQLISTTASSSMHLLHDCGCHLSVNSCSCSRSSYLSDSK